MIRPRGMEYTRSKGILKLGRVVCPKDPNAANSIRFSGVLRATGEQIWRKLTSCHSLPGRAISVSLRQCNRTTGNDGRKARFREKKLTPKVSDGVKVVSLQNIVQLTTCACLGEEYSLSCLRCGAGRARLALSAHFRDGLRTVLLRRTRFCRTDQRIEV